MVARVMRAMVRRAELGDVAAVEELARLERLTGELLGEAARAAHAGDGAYSWTEIGLAIGVSRQAARQRFGG
jgi:hypothetical protein